MNSVFRNAPPFSQKQLSCFLLIGAYAVLSLLAVCPALHHWVHDEAGHAEHHCVVTDLGDGSLLSQPPDPVLVSAAVTFFETFHLVEAADAPVMLILGSTSERAPPFSPHSTLL